MAQIDLDTKGYCQFSYDEDAKLDRANFSISIFYIV